MESKKVNDKFFKDIKNIELYEADYNRDRMIYFNENPDATEKDFILHKLEILNSKEQDNYRMWKLSDEDFYKEFRKDEKTTKATTWNPDEEINKQIILRKRQNYKPSEFENSKVTFYKNKLRLLPIKKQNTKINTGTLLDGKALNLLERFNIANAVLDIDKNIRKLNIPDLKKYELLAFILDCDKDNARNLMNGKYSARLRDLKDYLDTLNLKG